MYVTWKSYDICLTMYRSLNPVNYIHFVYPTFPADWAAMFQTMCAGCEFPIEPGDRWVEALGKNFHSECFNCSVSYFGFFHFILFFTRLVIYIKNVLIAYLSTEQTLLFIPPSCQKKVMFACF